MACSLYDASLALEVPGTLAACHGAPAHLLRSGQYVCVLRDPEVQRALRVEECRAAACPQSCFSMLADVVRDSISRAAESRDADELGLIMLAGAACLNIFVQQNLTGPVDPGLPSPLHILAPHLYPPLNNTFQPATQVTPSPPATLQPAVPRLASQAAAGPDQPPCAADASLGDDTSDPDDRWAGCQLVEDGEDLVGKLRCPQYLLLAQLLLVQYGYGYVDAGQQLLQAAGQVLGLEVELSGALGLRTAHQLQAKAQLVVHPKHHPASHTSSPGSPQHDPPVACMGITLPGVSAAGLNAKAGPQDTDGFSQESDVLLAPQLLGPDGPLLQQQYQGAEQALLLAWATHVRRASAQDELQDWQMAPYVEAVLMQQHSRPVLQVMARLLKIRHEKKRSRTRERALLHMEQLALELWDSLIVCYRLLDKKALAEEVIRRRLKVEPNNPVLWCGLGDLHLEESYYHEAWERAMRRKDWGAAAGHYDQALAINPLNPDAWFALGYCALKLGQQQRTLRAFTRVTQQQPDHGEAWNNLAALWLELDRPREAFSALTECLKHKRDSWQIWENQAQVALQSKQHVAAVQALKQVLDLSSGQRLHLDTVEGLASRSPSSDAQADACPAAPTEAPWGAAAGAAAGCVAEVSSAAGTSREGEEGGAPAGAEPAVRGVSRYTADLQAAEERSRQQMRSGVGALLKEAVNQACCTPRLWGLLGRYYAATGQPEGAKEALLKQVRGLTGTGYKSDEAKFIEMADASAALARAYIQLSTRSAGDGKGAASSAVAVRELAAARMHLRGVLKQCENSFGEHAAWRQLGSLLAEVTALEAASRNPAAA
ncbi:hypothetical protein V8C86DRAFT_3173802 [Haematococcus lacustris]